MFNHRFIIVCGILYVMCQSVFSQTTLFQSNTKTSQPAGAVKVLSPSEFSSSVKSLGQENQNQLKQQANQAIEKMSKPVAPVISTPPPKPETEAVNTTPETAAPPAVMTEVPDNTSTPTKPPPIQATLPTTEPETPAPTTAPPPTTVQTPSYSGFGNSTSNQGGATSGQPAGGSGGGWNIKY